MKKTLLLILLSAVWSEYSAATSREFDDHGFIRERASKLRDLCNQYLNPEGRDPNAYVVTVNGQQVELQKQESTGDSLVFARKGYGLNESYKLLLVRHELKEGLPTIPYQLGVAEDYDELSSLSFGAQLTDHKLTPVLVWPSLDNSPEKSKLDDYKTFLAEARVTPLLHFVDTSEDGLKIQLTFHEIETPMFGLSLGEVHKDSYVIDESKGITTVTIPQFVTDDDGKRYSVPSIKPLTKTFEHKWVTKREKLDDDLIKYDHLHGYLYPVAEYAGQKNTVPDGGVMDWVHYPAAVYEAAPEPASTSFHHLPVELLTEIGGNLEKDDCEANIYRVEKLPSSPEDKPCIALEGSYAHGYKFFIAKSEKWRLRDREKSEKFVDLRLLTKTKHKIEPTSPFMNMANSGVYERVSAYRTTNNDQPDYQATWSLVLDGGPIGDSFTTYTKRHQFLSKLTYVDGDLASSIALIKDFAPFEVLDLSPGPLGERRNSSSSRSLDDNSIVLNQVLLASPNLRRLDLSNTNLTTVPLRKLTQGLLGCGNLTVLNLDNNCLSGYSFPFIPSNNPLPLEVFTV